MVQAKVLVSMGKTLDVAETLALAAPTAAP